MKTVLYIPTYMNGDDSYGGGTRFARVMKFGRYYLNQDILKFDQIYCMDNGSDEDFLIELQSLSSKIKIQRNENLPRRHGLDMPYIWRYFWNLKNLTQFDKILIFDTDTFVLSQKFADFINNGSTGWRTVRCPKYGFPDGVGFLCRDAYPIMYEFTQGDVDHMMRHNNTIPLEDMCPFTNVHEEFVVDRFGEDRIPQRPDMDCYCQCQVDIEMKFNG